MTAPLVRQGLLHFDIRPKKAAYLIRPGSEPQFKRAIQHATSRWGGTQELIVPCTYAGRIDDGFVQMLEYSRPDVVFSVLKLSDKAATRVSAAIGQRPLPIAWEERPEYGLHCSAAFHSAILPGRTTALDSSGTATGAAATGLLSDYLSAEQLRRAGPPIVETTNPIPLLHAQVDRATPIGLTTLQTGELHSTSLSSGPDVLFVSDDAGLDDALFFWNARAFANVSMFPPLYLLARYDDFNSPEFVNEVRRVLEARPVRTTPDLVLASLSVSKPLLVGLRRRLGIAPPRRTGWTTHIATTSARSKLSAAVNADPLQFSLGDKYCGMRRSSLLTYGSKDVTVRSENPARMANVGGRVRVRLSGLDFLDVPPRPGIAGLIHRHATHVGDYLELETTVTRTYQFELSIPSPEQVLGTAIQSAGFNWELSSAGRLAQGVLDRIDQSSLRDLFDPTAIRAIDALTTPRSRSLAKELSRHLKETPEAVEVVVQHLGQSQKRSFRTLRDIANLSGEKPGTAAKALSQLEAIGLLQRGHSLGCSNCGITSFISAAHGVLPGVCPGCGSEADFARTNTGELAFFYRLNALLDRASDQGVMPHLFGAAALRERYSTGHFVYGAVVTSSNEQREVDFLGWAGRELLAGEAKTFANQFNPEQLERDVAISAALGATRHVICCLEPLDPDLLVSVNDLSNRHGMAEPVVVAPDYSTTRCRTAP